VTRPAWRAAFWAIVSAPFRRQVVARPLSYLVKGGHEGPGRVRSACRYAHRHQNFNVSSVGGDAERFHGHWDELRHYLDGLYLSFETDQRPQRLRDAFPGSTLTRLRELKASYDPENVFDPNFPVPPLPAV
jgi:hypothetical protein